MKFLKVLKKPIFIAALFAVMALTALATVTASAENQDFGGSVKGYQVSMQGRINLKFYYNDVDADMDDDDCYVAEIVGTEKTYTYPVSKIKDKNVISVPLAPSEMGYTVKITPVKVDGETRTESTKTVEYSVLKYAKAVLADQENAAYHNTMRALLNWGAKSQSYYYDAPAELVNVGIYSRNTNPISAVTTTTIKAPAHTVTSSDAGSFTVVGSELDLALSEGNVSLRFYIKSSDTTAATLDATIARAGLDTQNVKAVRVGDTYLVQIDSITANLFNSLYTVTISDGSDTFTTQGSVLEYLNKIVNGESKETVKKDEQIAVAQSLYQFYQLATGNTGAASCWHGSLKKDLEIGYHWIPAENAGESYYICSKCFAKLGNGPINDGVDLYLTSEQLHRSQLLYGSMTLTPSEENGLSYLNYTNMAVDSGNGQMTYRLVWDKYSTKDPDGEGISGKYLVFKIRLGSQNKTNRPNATSMTTRLFINGSSAALSNATQVDFNVANDGQWHTVVYELKNVVGFDEETGLGRVKYMEMRPFAIQWSTQNEDKTFNTAPASESEMDIQYMSICDDLTELNSVIDTDTYDLYTSSTAFTTHETSRILIDENVVTYTSAKELPNVKITGGTMDHIYTNDESGEYTRYTNMKLGGGSWLGYNVVENTNGVSARYLVFKIRLGSQNASLRDKNPMTTQFFVNTASTSTGGSKLDFSIANDDQWHTVVYELKNTKDIAFDAETGIVNVKLLQLRPFCVQWSTQNEDKTFNTAPTSNSTTDIQYISLCDDISDLQYIIDTPTYDWYTSGTAFETRNTSDNSAVSAE